MSTTHFALTASKSSQAPKEGQLNFHATMSISGFIAQGYADAHGINIAKNPHGNKHPKDWFTAWKSPAGESMSGAVSSKLVEEEDLPNAVMSIVSTPEKPEDLFVLLHIQGEQSDNIVVGGLK